jgi:hypothetical protein
LKKRTRALASRNVQEGDILPDHPVTTPSILLSLERLVMPDYFEVGNIETDEESIQVEVSTNDPLAQLLHQLVFLRIPRRPGNRP